MVKQDQRDNRDKKSGPADRSKSTKGGHHRGGYRGKGSRKIVRNDDDLNVALAPSGFKGRSNNHRSPAAAVAAYYYAEQRFYDSSCLDSEYHAKNCFGCHQCIDQDTDRAATYALALDFALLERVSINGCSGVLGRYFSLNFYDFLNSCGRLGTLTVTDASGHPYPSDGKAVAGTKAAVYTALAAMASPDRVRVDPADGMPYLRSSWVEYYGAVEGQLMWNAAGMRAARTAAPAAGCAAGSAGEICGARPRVPPEIAMHILSFIPRSEFGRCRLGLVRASLSHCRRRTKMAALAAEDPDPYHYEMVDDRRGGVVHSILLDPEALTLDSRFC